MVLSDFDLEIVVLNSIYLVIGIPGIILNLSVLFCLIIFIPIRKLRERNLLLICSYMFFSAVVCDAYVTVGLVRIMGTAGLNVTMSQLSCIGVLQPMILGCLITDVLTLMIACDRLFAVFFPIVYRNNGEHVRIGQTVGSFAFALLAAGCSIIGYSTKTMIPLCTIAAMVPTFLSTWTYGQIILCLATTVIYAVVLIKLRVSRGKVTQAGNQASVDKAAQQNRKMTVLVTAMISAYASTTVVANIIRQIYPGMSNQYIKQALTQFVGMLMMINSYVDLAIYVKKNEDIWKGFAVCLPRLGISKTQVVSINARTTAISVTTAH